MNISLKKLNYFSRVPGALFRTLKDFGILYKNNYPPQVYWTLGSIVRVELGIRDTYDYKEITSMNELVKFFEKKYNENYIKK